MTSTPSAAIEYPDLHARVAASFARQGLMRQLRARLGRVAPGEVEIWLPYSERVTQQQGGFHGGAMGAIGDIAGGYAAFTTVADDMEVVTVEYKINFLAMHKDGVLRATGHVVRTGRRLIVARTDVSHVADDGRTLPCAVLQQTMMPVPRTD